MKPAFPGGPRAGYPWFLLSPAPILLWAGRAPAPRASAPSSRRRPRLAWASCAPGRCRHGEFGHLYFQLKHKPFCKRRKRARAGRRDGATSTAHLPAPYLPQPQPGTGDPRGAGALAAGLGRASPGVRAAALRRVAAAAGCTGRVHFSRASADPQGRRRSHFPDLPTRPRRDVSPRPSSSHPGGELTVGDALRVQCGARPALAAPRALSGR